MVLLLRRRRFKIAVPLMASVLLVAASSAWVPSNHRRASSATTKKNAMLKEPFSLTDFRPAIYQWAAAGFVAASLAFTPLPSHAATDLPTGVRMEVETNKLIKSIQENKGELNDAISNIVKDKASVDIQLDPPASKADAVREALNAGKASTKEEVKTPVPEPKAEVKEDPKASALVKVEDVPATVKPEPTPSEFAPVDVKDEEPKQTEAKKADPPTAKVETQESKPMETKKEEFTPVETKKEEPKPAEEKKVETPELAKQKAQEEPALETPKPVVKKEPVAEVEAKKEPLVPVEVENETPAKSETKQEKPSSFSESVLEKLRATIETPIDEPKTEATKPEAPKPVEVERAESKPVESKKEESKVSESKKEAPKPVDESDKDQANAAEVTKLPTLKDLFMEKINENTPTEAPVPVPAPKSEASKSVTTVPPPPGEDESALKKKVYDWLFNYESPEARKIAIFDAQFWERPLIRTTVVSPDGTGDVNLVFTNGEVAAGAAVAIGVSYLVSYSLYDSERAEEERRVEAKRAAAAIKKKKPGYTVVNTDPEAKPSGTSFVDRLASTKNDPKPKDSFLNEISLQDLAKEDERRTTDDSYLDALSGASSSNSARLKKETKPPGGGSYLDSL